MHFVFVSTFNLQSNVIYIIFVSSSNFEIQNYKTESIFLNQAVLCVLCESNHFFTLKQFLHFHFLWGIPLYSVTVPHYSLIFLDIGCSEVRTGLVNSPDTLYTFYTEVVQAAPQLYT